MYLSTKMTCFASPLRLFVFRLVLFCLAMTLGTVESVWSKNLHCEDHLNFTYLSTQDVDQYEFNETRRKGILALAWSEELNLSMYAAEISKEILFSQEFLFRGMRLTSSELVQILKNGMTTDQISDPHFNGLYFSTHFSEAIRYSLSSAHKENALSVIFVMKSALKSRGKSGFAHNSIVIQSDIQPEDIHSIYVFDPHLDPLESPLRELKIRP